MALAKYMGSKDKYTAYHSSNVSRFSKLIAKVLDEVTLGEKLHDIAG
ncbi:hypothetical protein ACFSCX_10670 [Bacillus salitolerans]|uniref:Uncharacterized protein n=1 Tax=Bacillus salitolerans TaxID=1437434 RepID=A0ABW4LPL6_9BACI